MGVRARCSTKVYKLGDEGSSHGQEKKVQTKSHYNLRNRSYPKQQLINMILLIRKFERLSIHDEPCEDLSTNPKERVDLKGFTTPSFVN